MTAKHYVVYINRSKKSTNLHQEPTAYYRNCRDKAEIPDFLFSNCLTHCENNPKRPNKIVRIYPTPRSS